MKSSRLGLLVLSALVTLAISRGDVLAQAKPLTQEELLRQIENLAPSSADPGRGTGGSRNARPTLVPKASAVAGAASALFPEKTSEKKETKPEKKAKGPTEIVALEATFDQKGHIAIFIGDVVVTDPEFIVQADKLTAFLKHDDKPTDGAAPRVAAPASNADKDRKPAKGGGLERAIAEADPGKVVTVTQEKMELDGSTSRSVGHGKKVHYDSITGDITLYGKPDVQQGINTCVASEEGTIMILNRDGKMRVTGAHKTVIAEKLDK